MVEYDGVSYNLNHEEMKKLEKIMEEMANAPPQEPLPSNSHWTGKYMEKKAEQMKELTDAVDESIKRRRDRELRMGQEVSE